MADPLPPVMPQFSSTIALPSSLTVTSMPSAAGASTVPTIAGPAPMVMGAIAGSTGVLVDRTGPSRLASESHSLVAHARTQLGSAPISMDDIDKQIIDMLTWVPQAGSRQMAKRLHVDRPTVNRCLRQLLAKGQITRSADIPFSYTLVRSSLPVASDEKERVIVVVDMSNVPEVLAKVEPYARVVPGFEVYGYADKHFAGYGSKAQPVSRDLGRAIWQNDDDVKESTDAYLIAETAVRLNGHTGCTVFLISHDKSIKGFRKWLADKGHEAVICESWDELAQHIE